MDQNNLSSIIGKSNKTNKLYLRLLIGAVIVILVQAITNLVLANKQKLTIQVPGSSTETQLWVSSRAMSVDLLDVYSRDVITLGLNFTPETIETNFENLLRLFTPSLRSILSTDLDETVTRVKKNGISQSFFVDSVKVILASQTVYVRGFKKVYVNSQEIENKEQVYRIQFVTNNFTGKVNEFMLLSPTKDAKEIKNAGV